MADNLLSPIVLCFLLGMIAQWVRSDLKFPEPIYTGLSIYLLLAIGLKGGVALSDQPLRAVFGPLLAALGLGCVIPIWCYALLRWVWRYSVADAAAMAAHYGSVSAVTFTAALAFLDRAQIGYEAYAAALLAVMEVPAIIIALLLARLGAPSAEPGAGGAAAHGGFAAAMAEILTGRSIILLMGGLVIGISVGPGGYQGVAPFFGGLFQGALCLFLLDLGMLAASRARDVRRAGAGLVIFALLLPPLHAGVAALCGRLAGLSPGGAIILATLAASASYIAAPAAVRLALPQANPGLYLTASLAITFPFNLVIGIPFYVMIVRAVYGGW